MCDTLAVKSDGAVWFAKNSDREPDEPQWVEFHAGGQGASGEKRQCTYIEVEETERRLAVLISRPVWMWGAEMGVNEAGVAIGNEAVFSRRVKRNGVALLGMDLVRLGLERGRSASEAAEVITGLLEHYGQGGPAGYRNKALRYDNSFLIADAEEIFVLETAGSDWVIKCAEKAAAISNSYAIGADYDRTSESFSGGDFKAAHEAWLMPRLACASARAAASLRGIDAASYSSISLASLAALLRAHARGDGFDKGSNRDVCMHAGGPLRPSATTGSMIVKLAPGRPPRAAFTGTPSPCISLFKPAAFDAALRVVTAKSVWEKGARVCRRAARDPVFRADLRQSIAQSEAEILQAIETGDIARAETRAGDWAAFWLAKQAS